jgi:hypothetical protein
MFEVEQKFNEEMRQIYDKSKSLFHHINQQDLKKCLISTEELKQPIDY